MGFGDGSTRTVAQQIIFHRNWKWILDLPHSFYYLAGGGGGVTAPRAQTTKCQAGEGGAWDRGAGAGGTPYTYLDLSTWLLLPWKYDMYLIFHSPDDKYPEDKYHNTTYDHIQSSTWNQR